MNKRQQRDVCAAAEILWRYAQDLYDSHVIVSTGKIQSYKVKLEIASLRKLSDRLRRIQ